MKYDSKVSTLEERDELDDITVDELHGIFTAYEMRTGHNEPSRKEATFKALSKNQLLEFECHLDLQTKSYDNVATIEWRMNIQTKKNKPQGK